MYIHVLMRDEKEERKKQARSNKQTRQSNIHVHVAHPRQSLFRAACTLSRQCTHADILSITVPCTTLTALFQPGWDSTHVSGTKGFKHTCTYCDTCMLQYSFVPHECSDHAELPRQLIIYMYVNVYTGAHESIRPERAANTIIFFTVTNNIHVIAKY